MRLLEAQEAPAVRVLTVPMRRQPCSSEHRRHRHNRRNSCATTQQRRYDAIGATQQQLRSEYAALRAKRRATRVTDHTAYAYARLFDGVRCTSDGIALQARRFACWHGCADRVFGCGRTTRARLCTRRTGRRCRAVQTAQARLLQTPADQAVLTQYVPIDTSSIPARTCTARPAVPCSAITAQVPPVAGGQAD
jgi:hypothetical protein